MRYLRTFALGTVAAAALVACGGGSSSGGAPAVSLQSGSDVPDSAAANVSSVVAFILSLVNSETAEPITIGNATLATSETAEPEPVAP